MTASLRRSPRTLAWRLLGAILPTVAVGVSAAVLVQYSLAKRQLLTDINRQIRDRAARTAGDIDGLLRQRIDEISALAESPLIADYYRNVDYHLSDEAEMYRQELERNLRRFSRREGVYSSVRYLDARGREVCAVGAGSPALPVPLAALPADAVWTSGLQADAQGRVVLLYAKPVRDETGELKGALVLAYDLSQVARLLASAASGPSGAAYLATAQGRFPPGAGLDAGGSRVLETQTPLLERPWRVVVEASADGALTPLKRIRDAALLIALATAGSLIIVLLWLVRSVTRPVAALVDAAHRVGAGDLAHRIPVLGDGELAVLSGAFNEMAAKLESDEKARAELQTQLIQAEKLSAIGLLVSAVAHELRNPLGVLSGCAQIALEENRSPDPQVRADFQAILDNAKRCEKVVKNLLFFARKSRHERLPVDLNEMAASALGLLEYRLVKSDHVAVEREFAARVPPVLGDFQQLVQVLINLINNACDALEERRRRDAPKRLRLKTWTDGGQVFLRVEDNGPGIPAAIRGRLFEPFVTTKEPGHGTGLGLSISRQILADHGGRILLEDSQLGGAAFTLVLPEASEEDLRSARRPSAPPLPGPIRSLKILVVDDEKDFPGLVARALTPEGHSVETATSGNEALRLLRERRYDLVISDFEMEAVKGKDIFLALSDAPPAARTKLLIVSGNLLSEKVLEFLAETKVPCLEKPCDVAALQQQVRRMFQPETNPA